LRTNKKSYKNLKKNIKKLKIVTFTTQNQIKIKTLIFYKKNSIIDFTDVIV